MFRTSLLRFLTQGLVLVGTAITSIAVSRLLGVEGRGVYVLVTLVPSLTVVLTNMGVGQGILYKLASGRYSKGEIWTFALVFSFLWGILVWATAFLVIRKLPSQILKLNGYTTWLLVALTATPFILWRICLGNYLVAQHRFDAYNLMDLAYVFSQMAAITLSFFLIRDRFVGIMLAWLLVNIGVPICVGLVTYQFTYLGPARIVAIAWSIVSYGMRAHVASLMQFFNYRLDSFLVVHFASLAALGLYSVAVAMAESIWQISGASATILYPKIASVDSVRANELTPRVCRVSFSLTLLCSVVLAGASPWVVRLLYSDAFSASVVPLLLLLPGVTAFSAVRVINNDLAGRGRPGLGSIITGAGLILTVILDLFLIPRWGIAGAAFASSVSYSISAVVALLVFRRVTSISISELLFLTNEDVQQLKLASQRMLIRFCLR